MDNGRDNGIAIGDIVEIVSALGAGKPSSGGPMERTDGSQLIKIFGLICTVISTLIAGAVFSWQIAGYLIASEMKDSEKELALVKVTQEHTETRIDRLEALEVTIRALGDKVKTIEMSLEPAEKVREYNSSRIKEFGDEVQALDAVLSSALMKLADIEKRVAAMGKEGL